MNPPSTDPARTAAPPADAAPLADPLTPAERLIALLQGVAEPTLADAGIAARAPRQLDALCLYAGREAEACRDRSELLLELLETCLDAQTALEAQVLMRIAQQLRLLARDQHRWRTLADNAAYYRDNAEVAARIARSLEPAAPQPSPLRAG